MATTTANRDEAEHVGKLAEKVLNRQREDEAMSKLPNANEKEVMVFSKKTLKEHEDNVRKALNKRNEAKEKYDAARGAVTTAYANAEKAGVTSDALKFIIEKHEKFDEDFKARVNVMQEMRGEEPVFHFLDEEGYDPQRH